MMTAKANAKNSSEVKQSNRTAVLNWLLQEQPLSRSRLVELTGLSFPTITHLINDLIQEGIAQEGVGVVISQTRMGRRRQLLELVAGSRMALAIHLGSPGAQVGLVDLLGNIIIAEPIMPELAQSASQANLQAIFEQARALVRPHHAIVGVGIGYPSIPWDDVDIHMLSRDFFDLPTTIHNNVQAMALGEYIFGQKRSVHSLVFVYVGRGIGSGIIINGGLWRGFTGNAGQDLGHIRITDAPVQCRCGRTGCLEAIASETALLHRARDLLKLPNAEPDHVLDRLRYDQASAEALLYDIGHKLYSGIDTLAAIVNPEMIVIGGRLARIGTALLDGIGTAVQERQPGNPIEIQTSVLGEDVGLIGAGALSLLDQIYSPQFST